MSTYQFFSTASFLSTAVCFICMALVMHQKPSSGQKLTLSASFFTFLICLGYWGVNLYPNEQLMVFSTKIIYIGACNCYVLLLALYLQYIGINIRRVYYAILGSMGIVLMFFTSTIDMNPLFYKSYHVEVINGFPKLIKEYGIMHSVYTFMVMGYMISFIYFYLYSIKKIKRRNKHAFLLALIAVIPSAMWLCEKILDTPFDITQFGLEIADLCLTYLIIKQFNDINEIANDMLVDYSEDAYIIVDANNKFVTVNKLAKKMFPELLSIKIYDVVTDSKYKRISELLIKAADKDYSSSDDDFYQWNNQTFKLSYQSIVRHENEEIGFVLGLKDVTTEYEHTHLLENYKNELEDAVATKTKELTDMHEQMIFGFAALIENKNLTTGGHIKRTSNYVYAIANELLLEGKYTDKLNKKYIESLRLVAPLHDIGKISVPDAILNKPESLSVFESEVIMRHPIDGAKIVDLTMKGKNYRHDYHLARNITLYHHEKWDGTGYPTGLKGQEIPLSARIMSVADVFDALTSSRSYKEAFIMDDAIRYIEEESGKSFDPDIVKALINIREDMENLAIKMADK